MTVLHRFIAVAGQSAEYFFAQPYSLHFAAILWFPVGDIVDVTILSRRPEVHSVFTCRFLIKNGQLGDNGFLVLADTHFLILCGLRSGNKFEASRMLASLGALFTSALVANASSCDVGRSNNKTCISPQKTDPRKASAERSYSSCSSSNFADPSANITRAIVVRCVPLLNIRKITSNSRIPELISFIYVPDSTNDLAETPASETRDRVYIEDSGSAVKVIKGAVFHANESRLQKQVSSNCP
ncbi:unnamed protein product [Protopolystoma xenopodis]|uniref:Uncharacterized protein n=1 Tax=Protopolystoma xenopodis TaxID=117903 RepID=A0A3S5FCA3_9PLAT|nr:unnamed protein product [Protopolystoma xenopodis]